MGQSAHVVPREVSVNELGAEKIGIKQELRDAAFGKEEEIRTGGIPISGPPNYPTGPKPHGKGGKKPQRARDAARQTRTLVGKPTGLVLADVPSRREYSSAKRKTRIAKGPPPSVN